MTMGVTKQVIKEGNKTHYPKKGDRVDILYTGKLENGTIFDESRTRYPFFTTRIGEGDVIKGWDVAVPQMSIGERAILSITSDFAYGELGFPGLIPPNSNITFEVELIHINGKSREILELEDRERYFQSLVTSGERAVSRDAGGDSGHAHTEQHSMNSIATEAIVREPMDAESPGTRIDSPCVLAEAFQAMNLFGGHNPQRTQETQPLRLPERQRVNSMTDVHVQATRGNEPQSDSTERERDPQQSAAALD